jgi:hypothetical protein
MVFIEIVGLLSYVERLIIDSVQFIHYRWRRCDGQWISGKGWYVPFIIFQKKNVTERAF